MGYKQSPGRMNMPKTGRGVDTVALMTGSPARQNDPVDGYKKELENVRKRDSEGGFMNTLKNIGTGLSHGFSSVGYDSSQYQGKNNPFVSGSSGTKDIGKSISSAVSTAYNYAKGNIPEKVTDKDKPKKVRAAQKTYLD